MIYIEGHYGLGDCLIQRPFVRQLCDTQGDVWLETPWPQIYWDMPQVHCVRSPTRLRTQAKNMDRSGHLYQTPPANLERLVLRYTRRDVADSGGVVRALERIVRLPDDADFSFSPDPAWIESAWRTDCTCLFRPPTLRHEWNCPARNPDPAALDAALCQVIDHHRVISVADLKPGEEWFDDYYGSHERMHCGQLSIEQIVVLAAQCELLIGGPGFLMPLGIALGVSTFIVFGGFGAMNHPAVLTDPRMNLDRFGFVTPEPMCMCDDQTHNCHKQIPHDVVRSAVESFMETQSQEANLVA